MPTSVDNVLGAQNLIGLIQGVVEGIPNRLPTGLLQSNETVEGNRGSYTRVEGNRKNAMIVQYGSPSERAKLQGISEVPVTLIHTFEHQMHQGSTLLNLMAEDNPGRQQRGQQSIARQVRSFGSRFANLRTTAASAMIHDGELHVAPSGAILPSSSGALYTIDAQVPAAHKSQLDVFGDGDLLDANWETSTTDIIGQITAVKEASMKVTGYPIMHAIYGSNILALLMGNDAISQLVRNNPGLNQAASAGEIGNGLMGLNWWPGWGTFYEDNDGTLQDLVGANDITFIPDPSPEWWDMLNGTYLVPNQLNVGSTASDMLGALSEVAGAFSYAELATDPPGIKHYSGDTFLPVLKVPKAVFQGTVPVT